ncbi:hypothetical protein GCM10010452_25750 [Crossiella cryophila]
MRTGDPVIEQLLRTLAAAGDTDDLYVETAAAFLATHLLTRGRRADPPGPEHAAVRAVITAQVHLSVYHFIRVFRAATGLTPHRFLTRLRIDQARRLLSDNTLSIAQIAERCGFASPGALSTAFLAQVGVRPSAYRKN